MSTYADIYAVVEQIPRGRVTSYGRIARRVGCTARQVGYAMAAADKALAWHRVVNSKGEISPRSGDGQHEQRQRLLSEGIHFDRHGRIDFARFGWHKEFQHLPDDWQPPPQTELVDK